MVSGGLTRADVEDPEREIAFPDSVVGMFRGELGRMPGGFPRAAREQDPQGRDADRGTPRRRAAARRLRGRAGACGGGDRLDALGRRRLLLALLSQGVADYAARNDLYGPVSALPTDVFFYGLAPRRDISVEIERGHTLVIRCLAVGETDEEGAVRVFFELNGQPRTVKVENREAAATVVRRPKADSANPCHVSAPMPGVVASIAVASGRHVVAGDLLMTIEAMKMENRPPRRARTAPSPPSTWRRGNPSRPRICCWNTRRRKPGPAPCRLTCLN